MGPTVPGGAGGFLDIALAERVPLFLRRDEFGFEFEFFQPQLRQVDHPTDCPEADPAAGAFQSTRSFPSEGRGRLGKSRRRSCRWPQQKAMPVNTTFMKPPADAGVG